MQKRPETLCKILFLIFFTPLLYGAAPGVPSNFSATAVSSTQINLAWKAPGANPALTQYELHRSEDNQKFSKVADLAASAVAYEDKSLKSSTKYYYRLYAFNKDGSSNPAAADATTRFSLPPVNNLGASSPSPTDVKVKWGNGYPYSKIELRYTTNSNYTGGTLLTLGATSTEADISKLTPNTRYYISVQAFLQGEGIDLTADAIRTQVTTLNPTPDVPANLKVSNTSTTSMGITWTAVSGAGGYQILYATNAAMDKERKTLDVSEKTVSTTLSGLSPNTTYWIAIRAKKVVNNTDYWSAWSSSINTTTNIEIPAAPTALALTVAGATQINLKWSDNSNNETGFDIERSTNGTSFTALTSVEANVTTYGNTDLSASTTYYYRVRAKNAGGTSGWSNVEKATTQEVPVTAPAAPTALGLSVASATQINLKWNDNSNNETGFDIERSTNGTTWSALISVAANVTTYQNTGLSAATKYYYRVRAKNTGGNSGWSNVADATTQDAPVTVPTAPTALALTVVSATQINLKWNDNSNNETGFDIERSTNGTTWSALTSVAANVTTYQNTGLTAATKYYYRVRAKNTGGNSGWSNVADATTQEAPVTAPAAPTALTLTVVSATQINLKWNDNSNNETGFDIERSANGTTWSALTSVAANVTTYQNTGLTAATTYYYRVRAKNAGGNSGWSNVANATTQAQGLAAPGNLRLSATVVLNQINLQWNDNSNDETAFEISKSPDGSTAWEVLNASLPANTTTYKDESVRTGMRYAYRVRAVKGTTFSSYSNVLVADAPVVNGFFSGELQHIKAYPNPFKDKITIKNGEGLSSVELYDTGGVLLKSWKEPQTAIYDLTGISGGTYLLVLRKHHEVNTIRIMKH